MGYEETIVHMSNVNKITQRVAGLIILTIQIEKESFFV